MHMEHNTTEQQARQSDSETRANPTVPTIEVKEHPTFIGYFTPVRVWGSNNVLKPVPALSLEPELACIPNPGTSFGRAHRPLEPKFSVTTIKHQSQP